jgi:hypothetical protein
MNRPDLWLYLIGSFCFAAGTIYAMTVALILAFLAATRGYE